MPAAGVGPFKNRAPAQPGQRPKLLTAELPWCVFVRKPGPRISVVTTVDQERWDERYREAELATAAELPAVFSAHAVELGEQESALELACGVGRASVWLAMQGATVSGYDVSPVAVDQARLLAEKSGVGDLCTFAVADFDEGLPPGEAVGLILCHRFRDAALDGAIIDRLAPGGLLAIAALSEVGAEPGRFRVSPGELRTAFAGLEFIDGAEADGVAWLLARKT